MANNGLVQGLDARITAVVEELLRDAMDNLVAQIAAGLGGEPDSTPPPVEPPPARKSGSTRKAKRAPSGRAARSGGSSTKPTCNVVGCGRPQVSRGGCSRHYQLARKGRLPLPIPPGTPAPPALKRGRKPGSPARKAARSAGRPARTKGKAAKAPGRATTSPAGKPKARAPGAAKQKRGSATAAGRDGSAQAALAASRPTPMF